LAAAIENHTDCGNDPAEKGRREKGSELIIETIILLR
jgi:hypothetical protein